MTQDEELQVRAWMADYSAWLRRESYTRARTRAIEFMTLQGRHGDPSTFTDEDINLYIMIEAARVPPELVRGMRTLPGNLPPVEKLIH